MRSPFAANLPFSALEAHQVQAYSVAAEQREDKLVRSFALFESLRSAGFLQVARKYSIIVVIYSLNNDCQTITIILESTIGTFRLMRLFMAVMRLFMSVMRLFMSVMRLIIAVMRLFMAVVRLLKAEVKMQGR